MAGPERAQRTPRAAGHSASPLCALTFMLGLYGVAWLMRRRRWIVKL